MQVYIFKTAEDRYSISGLILQTVKNIKENKIQKMKHVKGHILCYIIYDKNEEERFNGNASKNWRLMKDQINEVREGKIKTYVVEKFHDKFY